MQSSLTTKLKGTTRLTRILGCGALLLCIAGIPMINVLKPVRTRFDTLLPSPPVYIVTVSDAAHSHTFATQAHSMQCYAQQHGYKFILINPAVVAPTCEQNHEDFFFRKHCAVSRWLLSQPPGTTAFVLDGDNVGGTSNRSLSRWLSYDFDIAFYERSWNFEITAGNYIVRNTLFSRLFLLKWASYEYSKPFGFSSSDNGAIHMAILDALAIRKRQVCHDQYRALRAPVTNLVPYYKFISCTRALLGPPRTHIAYAYNETLSNGQEGVTNDGRSIAGKITVFPRFFGFSVDAYVHGLQSRRNLQPFHHGIKKNDWPTFYVQNPDKDGFSTCKPFKENGTISDYEMGKLLQESDYTMINFPMKEAAVVPRWKHLDEDCYKRLWCGPLEEPITTWPPGIVSVHGTVQNVTLQPPGEDWYNEFTAGMASRRRS